MRLATPDAAAPILDASRRDPTWFCRAMLGFTPWSKQQEILRSVRRHRRTLVPSGFNVGKTMVAAALICEWMSTRPQARVVCTATTNHQVHDVLWAKVRTLYAGARIHLGGKMLDREWVFGPEWKAVAKAVEDETAHQGVHGPAVLVVLDEAEGIEAKMVQALDGLMSSAGSRMVAFFNPRSTQSWCYAAAQRPDIWNAIPISCLDHPNVVSGEEVIPNAVTRQWVEETRASEGEDSDYWLTRVLGVFPSGGTKQLIRTEDLQVAADVGGISVDEEPRAGLDVARFGGDRNVCVVFDARRRMVARESWTGVDLMATAGRAMVIARRHGARLRIDVCGIGAGVVDRLRETGAEVDAVDFGSGPKGDWRGTIPKDALFKNRRAELHWVTRTLIREKAICIPREFRDVWADLVVPEYDYDSSGRITIEEKESIRKRTGRSPDFGDAVHIAMSNRKRGVF